MTTKLWGLATLLILSIAGAGTYFLTSASAVASDFIPLPISEIAIPGNTVGFFVNFIPKKNTASTSEIQILSKRLPSSLHIPENIENGSYEMKIFASPYMGDGPDTIDPAEFTLTYQTDLKINRSITNSENMGVTQVDGPKNDNLWYGVTIEPYEEGKESGWLAVDLVNNGNFAFYLQAMEMGTEAGGFVNDIDSFSLVETVSMKKLSTLSDLHQLNQSGAEYDLYLLDSPVQINPGEKIRLQLRGIYHPEEGLSLQGRTERSMVLRSAPNFSVVGIIGTTDEGVLRKRADMMARAMFYDPTSSGLLIPPNY